MNLGCIDLNQWYARCDDVNRPDYLHFDLDPVPGASSLVFRDNERVILHAKAGKPLTRYFPELVASVKAVPEKRFVVDGEIVVPVDRALSFDHLLQRIHPAASRVRTLSERYPALLLLFHLLVNERGTGQGGKVLALIGGAP